MSVFADTSALYTLLVGTEEGHAAVKSAFADLLDSERPIWTTSFVIVETMALLQHRIGLAAARDFDDEILPVLKVQWVDEELYRQGADRLWREDRRQVSLVDCIAFEFMKRSSLSTAFAIDPHFRQAGYTLLPASSG